MTLIMQLIFNLNYAISQYTVCPAPCCGIKYRRKNTEKRGSMRRFSSNNYGHRGGISGSKYSQVSSVKVYSQKFPPYSLGLGHRCKSMPRGPFLESPETFRAYFGRNNSLCIFKTKASRGTKLCSYYYFYSPYNILKDQLCRISRSKFYEWLFEKRARGLFLESPEDFSGPKSQLSNSNPLVLKS